MEQKNYWDSSWKTVDLQRIRSYVNSFDMQEDAWISLLKKENVHTVCDAGCGCGIYALKLAKYGFTVSGFDVAEGAVKIAEDLLKTCGYEADLKTAGVTDTGYADDMFDAVICRDVLDHIRKADAIAGIKELIRIIKPGGILLFTLDALDEEYVREPHSVNQDGDYGYTSGKWKGMVFHPYSVEEVRELIPSGIKYQVVDRNGEMLVILRSED